MARCLFCGRSDQPPSTEDVIPKWLARAFDVSGPISVHLGGARPDGPPGQLVHRRPHLRLPLRGLVCEPCNNRLGGELEKPASELLPAMVVDASVRELVPSQQQLLAAWSTKTALLVEYAAQQRYSRDREVPGYLASEPEFAWLERHLEPPPRSRVWLSAFDAKNTITLRHESCLIQVRDSLTAHLTTLTLGYVAFQVFTINYVLADSIELEEFNVMPPEVEQLFTPIWPRQQEPQLLWPTRRFDDRSWHSVASWPSRVRRRA